MVNGIVQFLNLGYVVYQVVKVEWLESSGFGILNHTDSAAGVDDEYVRLMSVHIVECDKKEERGEFIIYLIKYFQPILAPGVDAEDGEMTVSEPSALTAERIIPSDSIPQIFLGARFAIYTTCFPTSVAGS